MLSKSLIQFSVDGQCCVPSLLFDLRPNYGGGNEDSGDLLQKIPLLHSVPLTLQQATANPHLHWRLLDVHWQVLVSLLWDHGSFLLGSGGHKVLFETSKSLFPQSCVISYGSLVGLIATSSNRAYATSRSAAPRTPGPCSRPLLTHISTGDIQRQFQLSLRGFSGSWCAQCLFEPSKHLWWVWGLILNAILPLLPSCYLLGFLFCRWMWVSLFRGIQHSADGRSATSCNFGILTGEDEHMSFYSTILKIQYRKLWMCRHLSSFTGDQELFNFNFQLLFSLCFTSSFLSFLLFFFNFIQIHYIPTVGNTLCYILTRQK